MKIYNSFFKIIFLFFTLAGCFFSAAGELSAEDWQVGISSRFRWEDFNSSMPINDKQFSILRIRSHIAFTGIEGVRIFFEPQYNKILGRQDGVVGSSGNPQYDGSIDSINMRTGYLDFRLMEGGHFVIGRQDLSYGDQYIMGAADWGPYGRTFDALRFRYKKDGFWMDLFQAKLAEVNFNAVDHGRDKDLLGLYSSWTSSGYLKAVDFYGFYLTDGQKANAATADPSRPWDFGVYGTRLVGELGSLSGKIEVAQNFGDEKTSVMDENTDNYMVDAQVNYQLGGRHKHGIGLRLYIAGTQWRELYPTPHSLFGRTDILGRRNLMGTRLRWNAAWSDDFSTTLDFFTFNRLNKNQNAFQLDSKTPLVVGTSKSGGLGHEVDFNIKKNVNSNMSIGAGVNVFLPGLYFEQKSGNAAHFGYFMIEARY